MTLHRATDLRELMTKRRECALRVKTTQISQARYRTKTARRRWTKKSQSLFGSQPKRAGNIYSSRDRSQKRFARNAATQLCLSKQHGQECCHGVQYCAFVQTVKFLTMYLIGIEQHRLPRIKFAARSPDAHLLPFSPALNRLK